MKDRSIFKLAGIWFLICAVASIAMTGFGIWVIWTIVQWVISK